MLMEISMSLERIACCVDFSKNAEAAFLRAIEITKKFKAKLYIVHVLPLHGGKGLNGKLLHTCLAEYLDELRHKIEAGCSALLGDTGLSLTKNRIHLLAGSPAAVIPEFVQKKGIDLIVMGSHGRKVLDRMLFGSTATRVVKHARCPVLTVRRQED